MVGQCVAACNWILENYNDNPVKRFYLSPILQQTKASQVNIMRTRGKRVTAEITFKKRSYNLAHACGARQLAYHYGWRMLARSIRSHNNGLHSANAITAMFIATGQDVANNV